MYKANEVAEGFIEEMQRSRRYSQDSDFQFLIITSVFI